jgi:hypothetical protein
MELSMEELTLINEVLLKAKSQSETNGFVFEKQILDNCYPTSNENADSMILVLYEQLFCKIKNAINEMKIA